MKEKYGASLLNEAWDEAFEQAYRRAQSREWDVMILGNLKVLKVNGRDSDYHLALLTKFNAEITSEELTRRLKSLPRGVVRKAHATMKNEALRGIDWDT
jgi:hypothetical protein